jgi:predicted dehydrogenase
MTAQHSRRKFIRRFGAGTAGLMTAGSPAKTRGFAANETLNIGCIGTGGRCRQLMTALGHVPGTKIVAVCDIWDANLERGRSLADSRAFATKDHHKLLERRDVDAVIIGAPDHWHVPLTIDALAAGKHIYCEKPLTHRIEEGETVLAAQNQHPELIVQVGMQQRSMPQFLKAYEIVRSGVLGEICKVHLTWNRNQNRGPKGSYGVDPRSVDWKRFLGKAPDQPFDEYRFRNWRWFWDFGGGIFTDLMVHYVDVAHWFLDLEHPEVAVSLGTNFMKGDLWQTPDTVQTVLRYPGRGVQVYFEGTFSNARNGAMLEFMGSNATLYLDRGRYEIYPERNKKLALPASEMQMILGPHARGQDFYLEVPGEVLHLANWIECIRERKQPRAPVEQGVRSAAAAHLANQALRTNHLAHWNA